jgi:hypothetical protein
MGGSMSRLDYILIGFFENFFRIIHMHITALKFEEDLAWLLIE